MMMTIDETSSNILKTPLKGEFCLLMPYRKSRVYSGLNAKVLFQHLSTPTSVVKLLGL